MYLLEMELPGLPPTMKMLHMAPTTRKKWATWVYYKTGFNVPREPLKKAKITIIRCAFRPPGSFESLFWSMEPILNGLVRSKIISKNSEIIPVIMTEQTQHTTIRKVKIIVEEIAC